MSAKNIVMAAAGAAPEKTYIEDVFSTFLYTGNGGSQTQTISNGIDLLGKGGMVWIKSRSAAGAYSHQISDTVRGLSKVLESNNNQLSTDQGFSYTALSDGFSFNTNQFAFNLNNSPYCSWTFRRAPKFFDVVTWSGAGNQTISHTLGSVPGCIVIKRLGAAEDWYVYHRGLPNTNPANLDNIILNSTAAYTAGTGIVGNVTSTTFDVRLNTTTSPGYVAYLFAHDTAADGLIQCGSFTTDASGNASVTLLGWEPQFLLVKASSTTGDWFMLDQMRGWNLTASDNPLRANLGNTEVTSTNYGNPTSTGFQFAGGSGSATYVYMAIRRPNKPPTTGASVFVPVVRAGTSTAVLVNTGIVTDAVWESGRSGQTNFSYDRARGPNAEMSFTSATSESTYTGSDTLTGFQSMNGFFVGADPSNYINGSGINYIYWAFRRAAGFFDVVCYTGTGGSLSVSHNLGAKPEFVIIKCRSNVSTNWIAAFQTGAPTDPFNIGLFRLNTIDSELSNLASSNLTSTTFVTGPSNLGGAETTVTSNLSGSTYVAYLFASLLGVSKVGTYTGNGSSQVINCGFAAGARFVLVKRRDSTGDWYVWDSVRGIISGNDPYLRLNSTAAEVTSNDSIDPDSTGFVVNQVAATNINVSSATYVYLAIA